MKKALFILICIQLFTQKPLCADVSGGHDMAINYKNQSDEYWQKNLSPEVYKICRDRGTEPAFSGKYDAFYQSGTYYCACCGGDFPLYSSEDKFDSKTGWPSYTKPISDKNVTLQRDDRIVQRLFGAVTEVLCARCGSHLGHVFDDGPEPTGKRHCINSLALKFEPKEQA